MNKWVSVGAFMGFSLLVSMTLKANPEAEGRTFAKELHTKGYVDQSAEINTLRQQFNQKHENQQLNSQASELGTTFEENYDSGKKGEDPLKSYFGRKNREASQNKNPEQPTLGDAELLLKQKHRFQVAPDDGLFKKYQEISQSEIKEGLFEKGQPPVNLKQELQDKIVTCRKGVAPELRTCEKRLVVKAVPQEPLVKTVTAYFTARCYNLVTFSIYLKTGQINVSQCENQGLVNVSVVDPMGEPDYPERTTVELISRQHFGEGGVDFRTSQMNPTYANGFSASFTAFQPKTGKKHGGNKNNVLAII